MAGTDRRRRAQRASHHQRRAIALRTRRPLTNRGRRPDPGELRAIDGVGSVLAPRGPCSSARATDSRRWPDEVRHRGSRRLESGGLLQVVIMHEMGHVLGYGTIWREEPAGRLLSGAPIRTSPGRRPSRRSTRWVGPTTTRAKVPVEDTGGEGTADAHWRESVFGNELMTGFVDASANPLSRVSVASMADLGYAVNLAGADPYTLAPGLRAFARGPRVRSRTTCSGCRSASWIRPGGSWSHPAVRAARGVIAMLAAAGGLSLGAAGGPAGRGSLPPAHGTLPRRTAEGLAGDYRLHLTATSGASAGRWVEMRASAPAGGRFASARRRRTRGPRHHQRAFRCRAPTDLDPAALGAVRDRESHRR